jgi:hypothetical protein
MISLKELLEEDIKRDIDKFIDKLNKQFSDQEYSISSGGGKYVRINHKSKRGGGESAWGFIALVDNPSKGFKKGDLLKAAGYNTPAKHARGNILDGSAKYDKYSPTYLREEINEAKTYKKGDKLKIKLPNGKKFDVVFVDYSRTKGIAYGKFKDGGEVVTKPFSLSSIVENVTEASPKLKHTISKKEWSKIPKYNKHIGMDGVHYIMKYDDKIGTYLQGVKIVDEDINEATTSWSKMMQSVRKGGSGPWSLVGIENKKVVAQKIDIRDKNLLPAHFEAMRKENPRAKIHIEDAGGQVVWNEKR